MKCVFGVCCFVLINLILGNHNVPRVSSCQQTSANNLGWPDPHPAPQRRWLYQSPPLFGFWFTLSLFVCCYKTRKSMLRLLSFFVFCVLPRQLYQERTQVACSNEESWKRALLEGAPAMDHLGLNFSFVFTLFVFKAPNCMLAQTLTERVVKPGTRPKPNPHPPRGCPSNYLGPVWANMYSDPFSSTTPAASGIDNPGCVKWRETLPSQEESAGREIPMGQLVTKVLVSRGSPLQSCQHWPGLESPVRRQ